PIPVSWPCRAPTSNVFPYTTLFRSQPVRSAVPRRRGRAARDDVPGALALRRAFPLLGPARAFYNSRIRTTPPLRKPSPGTAVNRSEEHTSELQSRFDLVCRLLLEKK